MSGAVGALQAGTTYWVTGLSGAGKTTLGRGLYERLRSLRPGVVFLDGDRLREVFGGGGYSVEERVKLSFQYANLCAVLNAQGIDVVCATVSLFQAVHDYLRVHLPERFTVLVTCEQAELERRDPKGLYSRARRGELRQVVGIDLPFDPPPDPALVIDNTSPTGLEEKVERICREIVRRRGRI